MHILAIFDSETARPPIGLEERYECEGRRRSTELERQSSNQWSQERTKRLPTALPVADGINWALQPSAATHYAVKDGVHALLTGNVSEWPGLDMVSVNHDAFVRGDGEPLEDNDASFLLQFYETFRDAAPEKTMPNALQALSLMKGRFAWIIYDAGQRRVMMARDKDSEEPLFWGRTKEGSFMVGSRLDDLAECNPTATAFPGGSLYVSAGTTRAVHDGAGELGWVMPGDSWPGQVRSFVPARNHQFRKMRAVPRINSRGAMCGAVYRVASEVDLTGANDRDGVC
mmetsp:Transcript_17226/g.51533  ORF Transcript_17226/g.51533 Transcript_17226/m.51533 type:complete len:285 (+) Transcript_17226:203-1057(+)